MPVAWAIWANELMTKSGFWAKRAAISGLEMAWKAKTAYSPVAWAIWANELMTIANPKSNSTL